MRLLVQNAHRDGWLLTEGDTIEAVGYGPPPTVADARLIDAAGLHLLPGLIDIHVHGACGADTMDATPQAIQRMASFYARHGVTGFLATTWTASQSRLLAALRNIADCLGPQPAGAALLGAHLEGPYLNPDCCGAQDAAFIRQADRPEALSLLDSGVLRVLSLAPEFEANHWLIEEAARRGITVSVAHSAATYDQMQAAMALGLRHATHTFNAMRGLHHREPGTVGAVLLEAGLSAELIADNIHVHPAVMKLLWQLKGPNQLVLVSDAVRVTGLTTGDYHLAGRPVTVADGAVRLADGTLAGSCLTMNRALHNFMVATGLSLDEAWPVASLNAARVIGLDDQTGSLAAGKAADFILMDDEANVHLTVVRGRIVYLNGKASHIVQGR